MKRSSAFGHTPSLGQKWGEFSLSLDGTLPEEGEFHFRPSATAQDIFMKGGMQDSAHA